MRFPQHWKAALLGLSAAFALGSVPGLAPPCAAQSDTGGMVGGRVLGPDGRAVPGAVLQLEAASGERAELVSDLRGGFHFAAVAPGDYTLRVHAEGLSDWEADHLAVGLETAARVNPRLASSWVHRTVLVDGRVAVEREHNMAATDGASNALATDVPNNSGQWSSEAAILSGSADDGDLSLRGLSPLMNGITVDGMNGKLAFRGRQRATEGNGFATVQSAVSAFHTAGSFSSESGRAATGAMTTVTKGGGNHMHGQAVLFDRGSFGQAANAFSKTMVQEPAGTQTANGQPVLYLDGQPVTYVETPYHAPDRRQRWEVAAGGPIRRDKLWWYFAWEQYERHDPAVARATEPELFFAAPSAQSLATLEGRIATSNNPLLAACPGAALGSTARAECAWTKALSHLNGMLGTVPRQTRQTIVFPKITWKVNARNQIVAQYSSMRRNGMHAALGGATETDAVGSFGNSSTSDDTAIARWDWFATPRLMSSVRYQYNRDLLAQTPGTPSAFEAQFANNAWGLTPEVSIDKSQGLSFGTLGTINKSKYPLETRQQLTESATWVHGRQALRFGYDYNYVTDELEGMNGENGAYSYASLMDFLSDMLAPGSCDGTTTGTGQYPCYSRFRQTVGPTSWRFQTADYAAYLANEWKFGQRLTLTLGVRYEYEQMPDTNPALVNADIPQTAHLTHDRTGFGPRGGIAWDVFGKGRTVLRGGYAIYTARVPNAMVFSALTTTGSARSPRTYSYRPLDVAAPTFPYVFSSDASPYMNPVAPNHNSTAPEAVYFDPHFRHPQIHSMELALQQELGFRTLLTLTGMATDGRFLTQFIDTNIDLQNWATLFYAVRAPGSQGGDIGPLGKATSGISGYTGRVYQPRRFYYQRLNPAYGAITDMVSETNSGYRGAVVQLTRRMSRVLTMNAAYTWAHAIDENQNEATFAERNDVYDPADLSLEHGTSNYDVRQRVAGGLVIREPWRLRGPTGMLLGGYSLAATGAWRTGLPWSMRTSGAVPTPSCSYANWLNAGGASGDGANCLKAVTQPDTFSNDTAGMAIPIASLGGSLNGSGGEDLLPPIGRNTFRYPATVNLDLRFTKTIRISDRYSFEVMGEAFNALNHRNVTNLQTIGYRAANDKTYSNMATLTWQSGIKPGTKTALVNGRSETQYVFDPTAAFGGVTNANSGGVSRERQLQLGLRLRF